MKVRRSCSLMLCGLAISIQLALCNTVCAAQSTTEAGKPENSETSRQLEKDFFEAIRAGDADKVLSYVSDRGVNIGSDAHHISRGDVEQQFQSHSGLYCQIFDSSCIKAPIDLGNSARTCSDRELLTHSEHVRNASSEVTRSGVQQAVLVAEVKNDQCGNGKLIDFIFNLDADGWKLFSIP
jgi:hypothetical protein